MAVALEKASLDAVAQSAWISCCSVYGILVLANGHDVKKLPSTLGAQEAEYGDFQVSKVVLVATHGSVVRSFIKRLQ